MNKNHATEVRSGDMFILKNQHYFVARVQSGTRGRNFDYCLYVIVYNSNKFSNGRKYTIFASELEYLIHIRAGKVLTHNFRAYEA